MNKFLRSMLAALVICAFTVAPALADPVVLLGNTNVESTDDYTYDGQAVAFQFVAAASGTTDKVKMYFTKGEGTSCSAQLSELSYQIGLYSDNNGHPGTLLGDVGSVYNPAYNQWWQTNGSNIWGGVSITADTTYWLAFLVQDNNEDSSIRLCFRDYYTADNPAGNEETSYETNLTALPSTWTTGSVWGDFSGMSAYVITAP